MTSDDFIRVQSTPNPNAYKFIVPQLVQGNGKATFMSAKSAEQLVLVKHIFEIDGVSQVHLFDNVITVSHSSNFINNSEDDFKNKICSVIRAYLPDHNPYFEMSEQDKKQARTYMSPELQKIESILDQFIRPWLQADGGDVDVVGLKDNILEISYQGACGGCPSAALGTLNAIEITLQNEYSPDIKVVVQDEGSFC